jgi:hypothetical protein
MERLNGQIQLQMIYHSTILEVHCQSRIILMIENIYNLGYTYLCDSILTSYTVPPIYNPKYASIAKSMKALETIDWPLNRKASSHIIG